MAHSNLFEGAGAVARSRRRVTRHQKGEARGRRFDAAWCDTSQRSYLSYPSHRSYGQERGAHDGRNLPRQLGAYPGYLYNGYRRQ